MTEPAESSARPNPSSGAETHPAAKWLVQFLSDLLLAKTAVEAGLVPAERTMMWNPSKNDYEEGLRILRERIPKGATPEKREPGWTQAIDAVIGFVSQFPFGGEIPAMKEVAREFDAYATLGKEVMRKAKADGLDDILRQAAEEASTDWSQLERKGRPPPAEVSRMAHCVFRPS
jgi:hypothetical protein